MYRIYFKNRCITICGTGDLKPDEPEMGPFVPGGEPDIHAVAEKFKLQDSADSALIPVDDVEGTYRRLCAEFKEVDAAGGLVRNAEGEYMLIRRNGLWDLPKGHREKGEDFTETALREVGEETGAEGLEPGKLICITDHCYYRDEIWHLKHIWWYDMLCRYPDRLVPQTEEGITEVAWVPARELPPYLRETYPSILEVFRKAGI